MPYALEEGKQSGCYCWLLGRKGSLPWAWVFGGQMRESHSK